jgi:hypothetical protein
MLIILSLRNLFLLTPSGSMPYKRRHLKLPSAQFQVLDYRHRNTRPLVFRQGLPHPLMDGRGNAKQISKARCSSMRDSTLCRIAHARRGGLLFRSVLSGRLKRAT